MYEELRPTENRVHPYRVPLTTHQPVDHRVDPTWVSDLLISEAAALLPLQPFDCVRQHADGLLPVALADGDRCCGCFPRSHRHEDRNAFIVCSNYSPRQRLSRIVDHASNSGIVECCDDQIRVFRLAGRDWGYPIGTLREVAVCVLLESQRGASRGE